MIEQTKLIHGGEITDFTKSVALPLHLGNRIPAAELVAEYLGIKTVVKNEAIANSVLSPFLQFLLDQQRYVDAATLLWTPSMFSGEPRSVKMIWDSVFSNVATMIPGASSMGKSFSLGTFCYLDWRRDPYFTNIQVIGPSEGHLERNLFSHLAKLHRNASVPGPGELVQLGITLDTVQRDSGIFGLVVPVGRKAAGRLQGVKIPTRPAIHPQFGRLGRLRVMLEEAENIPIGIWEDVINIMSNARGVDQFKIFAAYNPKDRNAPCAQRVEPLEGWQSIDLETSETWKSKRGWNVVRLDAYKSENVTTGQEIYPGLQTKEGLALSIQQAGGHGTAGYYTFARGWYPVTGIDLAIVPQHLMNDAYGMYEFVDTPESLGAVDVALEGGDNAVFMLGRLGLASGWRKPPVEGKEQPVIPFRDQYNQPVRREVLQVDQVMTMPKGDTVKLVNEIKRICQGAYIRGSGLGVDRTGNGAGVHDLLVANFHNGVMGINGSQSPSERRIVEEDQKLPKDEYQNLLSELWFAARKFIEFGLVKISPQIPQDPLVSELTGRLFKIGGAKTQVETKKEYKSRGNKSPDRADAFTILINVARRNMREAPSATGAGQRVEADVEAKQRVGVTDRRDRL